MSLFFQGPLAQWSVNARVFFFGTILEALLIPGMWLAGALLGARLSLFTALFSQGVVSMSLLYVRVRMTEIVRERRQEANISSALRRAPL